MGKNGNSYAIIEWIFFRLFCFSFIHLDRFQLIMLLNPVMRSAQFNLTFSVYMPHFTFVFLFCCVRFQLYYDLVFFHDQIQAAICIERRVTCKKVW